MPRRPHFWRRSFGGAALLLILVPIAIWANRPWWYGASGAPGSEAGYPSPASEEVLAAQPELLDDALDALEDERPGVVDLYFVGFASYAGEDVFRKDVERARDLLDDRFDTDGRSIVLINNPRTMLDDPLATITNLKATLNEIGKTINPDEDVVMLYLASHGSKDHSLAIEFWPLELTQLTPGALRKMLDDSGIKWRIIVVSACYSGGYIDALKDDNTLIITASATDRQSFGCGNESDSTYFGDAFFNRALRFDDSFVKAFEQARDYVAKREKAEGQSPPSNPQMVLGSAMAAKLKELEQALRDRRSTGNI
jgi:Peptidase C13 family